jgi:branched-chain amino acid transport system ATP-binding protein
VIDDVSFSVEPGEALGLLGRNGMGKTTTVRSIIGQAPWRSGAVRFAGQDTAGLPPYRLARLGVGLVPESRRVFPTLSVRENLTAFAARRSAKPHWTLEAVWDLFPGLAARAEAMGGHLSGGEQQMVAIGRALMTGPRLLILDEATEGLAPPLREQIWRCLGELRASGLTILVIDKHLPDVLRLTDRAVILEKGRVVWRGTSDALAADADTSRQLLGLAG